MTAARSSDASPAGGRGLQLVREERERNTRSFRGSIRVRVNAIDELREASASVDFDAQRYKPSGVVVDGHPQRHVVEHGESGDGNGKRGGDDVLGRDAAISPAIDRGAFALVQLPSHRLDFDDRRPALDRNVELGRAVPKLCCP